MPQDSYSPDNGDRSRSLRHGTTATLANGAAAAEIAARWGFESARVMLQGLAAATRRYPSFMLGLAVGVGLMAGRRRAPARVPRRY